MLGGTVTAGNTVQNLTYFNDFLTEICITNGENTGGAQVLDAALRAASGQEITVLAHSLGSVCCCYWLAITRKCLQLRQSGQRQIHSSGKFGAPLWRWCYLYNWFQDVTVPTNTPYTITDFCRQYDGWAIFPGQRGIGPVILSPHCSVTFDAVTNAYAGQSAVHPNYVYASLTNPQSPTRSEHHLHVEPTFPCPALIAIPPQYVMLQCGDFIQRSGSAVPTPYREGLSSARHRPAT